MGLLEDFDVAGFTDRHSKLGKRVPTGNLLVLPKAELNSARDSILWPWNQVQKSRSLAPTAATFIQFIALGHKSPVEILRFAQQWGALGVDEKGIVLDNGRREVTGSTFQEPLEAWRYFSRRAEAILAICAKLKGNKPGTPEEWNTLSNLWVRLGRSTKQIVSRYSVDKLAWLDLKRVAEVPVEEQGLFLQGVLVLEMKASGLGFAVGGEFPDLNLEIDLDHQLLAAIALQLVLTASGSDLLICSGDGCKRPYLRSRKRPKPGESNFCDSCGRGEALRQADHRRREKIHDARRLSSEGLSLSEITKRLEVRSPAIVRRWIDKGK